MDQGIGSNSVTSSGSFDKNKVMIVTPLRCLVPIFPSQPGMSSSSSPQTAPFVCVPPNGPFPPGYTSFYPFKFPLDSQNLGENLQNQYGIPTPVPLSSFRTPPAGATNGDSDVKRKGRPKGNKDSNGEVDAVANGFLSSFDLAVFDPLRKSEGDKELVRYVLMIKNFLRRRISRLEDSKEVTPGNAKRPDLRAAAILMNKGIRTNMTKRVGPVPGVEIGDIFFLRMELCLVGMHAPTMAGIDYMSIKIGNMEEPVAVSIVSSGGYDDVNEDTDVLIYSGQGGKMNRKDKIVNISDQKLERGNLALEKSLFHCNEVRVIRGLRDMATVAGKIYLYDGLYKIEKSWIESNSGFNIFKYKLVRIPGQPPGFALWKAIQQWTDGIGSRPGVILPDLTSGGESLPVSLVNNLDDEKGPAYFTYFPSLKYPGPVDLPRPLKCSCKSACDSNCPCVQKNGGSLPYNALGVLMSCKSIVHECGSSCSCTTTCRNRMTQAGIKFRLEVFKTNEKGWGLRSLDPIRSGAFICEYAGEVIDKSMEEQFGRNHDDNYLFDATRSYEPHEIMFDDSDESSKLPFSLVINAKNIGNVARFMNHSCCPNVYWNPVMRERDNEYYIHVLFFAINNIPPMTELTFDYGIIRSSNAEHRRKKCVCASLKCRGYFY